MDTIYDALEKVADNRSTNVAWFIQMQTIFPQNSMNTVFLHRLQWIISISTLCIVLAVSAGYVRVAAQVSAIPPQSHGLAAQGLDPRKPLTQYVHQVESTLPMPSITAIIQASNGYLCVGSFQSGLARFDGVKFSVFNPTGSSVLNGNYILRLFEAADSTFWIGMSGGGLVSIKNNTVKSYSTANGLADNTVQALCQDRNGGIWVGTPKGVTHLHNGTARTFTVHDGLPTNNVTALCANATGVWIGTNGGLCRFDASTMVSFVSSTILGQTSISALLQGRDSVMWIGTEGKGLVAWNGMDFTQQTLVSKAVENNVQSLCEDSLGTLWIGSYIGLCRLRRQMPTGDRVDMFTEAHGLTDSRIRALCADREGSLWIGTYRGGLNRLLNSKFLFYTKQHGLPGKACSAVFHDADSSLWVATENGLSHLKGAGTEMQECVNYTKADGLPDDIIRSVTRRRAGGIWSGTYNGGFFSLHKGKIVSYSVRDGLPDNRVRTLLEDDDGTLWLGTGKGLCSFKGGTFRHYTESDGITKRAVLSLHKARDGSLWICTQGDGLFRFNNGAFVHYTRRDGLAADIVFYVYEDRDGIIWVCTQDGLNRFYQGRWTTYLKSNGLSSNITHQIVEDAQGVFWIGTPIGLMAVRRQELNDVAEGRTNQLSPRFFTRADGMSSANVNTPAMPCIDYAGRLWFPTLKGIVGVEPERVRDNPIPPQIVIEQMRSDTGFIDIRDSIILPAGTRTFGFYFTALSMLAPEKVQFKVLLEGFNTHWLEIETKREAFYTNLRPGWYTFRVIACNNDGVWNMEGARLSFYLAPYFYETWWFYGLCGVLLVGSSYGAYRWQVQSLQRRAKVLEYAVQERTAELESIDSIVRSMNSQTGLDEMLQMLLEQSIDFISGAEAGSIILYRPETDSFYFVASVGYAMEILHHIDFRRKELIEYWVRPERLITEGVFFANDLKAQEEKPGLSLSNTTIASLPACTIGITIVYDSEVEGMLFLDNLYDEKALSATEAGKLVRLREHILSAFAKTRTINRLNRQQQEIQAQIAKTEHANRELHEKNIALHEALEELRRTQSQLAQAEKMASLGTLVAGVAHELNTPIGVAVTAASTLHGKVESFENDYKAGGLKKSTLETFIEQSKIGANLTLRNLERAANLIQSFKQVAVDQTSDSKREFNLGNYLEDIVASLTPMLKGTQHSIFVEHDGKSIIESHPGVFAQILTNLVQNSVRHGFEGFTGNGEIKIKVWQDGGFTRIEYSDNGRGIPAEILPRIFDPFFTTKPGEQGGTGLGLHIVYNLVVQKLGGKLRCDSQMNVGTTFMVELHT